MLVLEYEETNKTKPQNLPTGTPFKFIKGQMNATYVKTRNTTDNTEEIICLNSGVVAFPLSYDSTIVHPYTDIRPIVKPLTADTPEVKEIFYDEIKPGECFILYDTLYMKTDKNLMFNLKTKLLIEVKPENHRKVIYMPFVALELI